MYMQYLCMELGRRIKRLGVTRVANTLGVHYTTLWRWVNHKVEIDLHKKRLLLDAIEFEESKLEKLNKKLGYEKSKPQ